MTLAPVPYTFRRMEPSATPSPADDIPRALYYQLVHGLAGHLPPLATDNPEDGARQQRALLEHAASWRPANQDEANLAVLYAAASAQAVDCMRLTRLYANDPVVVVKCTAQLASMMRQASAFRSALCRAQSERLEQQDEPVAADTPVALEAEAAPVEPPPLSEQKAPPQPSPLDEAERYALHHRKRAVLIRRLGHLPSKFGWLAPEVVHAIATGGTAILRALDDKPRRPLRAAA